MAPLDTVLSPVVLLVDVGDAHPSNLSKTFALPLLLCRFNLEVRSGLASRLLKSPLSITTRTKHLGQR